MKGQYCEPGLCGEWGVDSLSGCVLLKTFEAGPGYPTLGSLYGESKWIFVVVVVSFFFETVSHCGALAGLKLAVDRAGLELTTIHLSLPHEGWPTTTPGENSLFWLSSKGWRDQGEVLLHPASSVKVASPFLTL